MYMCKHINTHRYLLTPDTTFQPNLHNYGYISGYRQPTQIHTLSLSFLSLSLSTRTHTCSYTHTRLMMMMSVDNRLKSTIMRPWKFWSLRLWPVATLRMSWNLVRQFPTLHHLQWSLSPHPMFRTPSHIHIHTHTHTHTHPHAHTNPTHTHICLRIFRNLYSPSHWCHLLVQFSFSVSLSTRTHTHVHTPTLGSWWWWQ